MTKPGRHAVVWDGRDTNGVRMPSGVYFSRIQAPAFTQTQKMLMLK
jgi:flagellar hook assembly protein FlgD